MGIEVTFSECKGHKIYPFTEQAFQDDYFTPIAKTAAFVGGDDGVYQLLGQHFCRTDYTRMCVKDILTGEVKDLNVRDFDGLTASGGPWRMLNEMEVIAWAAK